MEKSAAVDAYIASFPEETRKRLDDMRALIHETAPDAVESVSYGMPAYKLRGKPLVYFAGYRHHVGFYATPVGYGPFQEELASYKQGKGSVQFPHTRPLPLDLIRLMVAFRVDTLGTQTV